MKRIVLVCRSEKEKVVSLLRLVKNLFPECEVHIVYDRGRPSVQQPSPDRLKTSFTM
jgi:hypothetical protein